MGRLICGCVAALLLACETEAPVAVKPDPPREIDVHCVLGCKDDGRCTLAHIEGWVCIVASDADCQLSDLCKNEGKCWKSHADDPRDASCVEHPA